MIRIVHTSLVLFALSLLSCLTTSTASGDDIVMRPTDKGIAIESPALGKFTLGYPKLGSHPQTGVKISGNTAQITYKDDIQLNVEISGDTILLKPRQLPDDVKNLITEMSISQQTGAQCTWAINDKPAQSFPKDKPAKPHLYQGQGALFTLANAAGKGVAIHTPASYCYNELVDNREWNGNTFTWKVYTPVNSNWSAYKYKITPPAPGSAPAPETETKAAAPAASAPVADLRVSLEQRHIQLVLGPAKTLQLAYPALMAKGDKKTAPHDITVSGKSVTLKYPNGASAQLQQTGNDLKLTFADVPSDIQSFRMDMLISFNFSQGGKYTIGDRQPAAFPAAQPQSPMLYQGNINTLSLVHPEGGTLKITIPQYSFQQLQDNREWNWKTFAWWFSTPLLHDNVQRTFTIQFTSSGERTTSNQLPLVDQFGQNNRVEYPGKIHSIDELKQDVQDEQTYYASFSPPQLDPYGGLPGSGEKLGLTKTSFFHVQKITQPEERWVMVDPDGNAFFQLGLCCFCPAAYTYTEGREPQYQWIPPVAGEFADARPGGYWRDNSVSFHIANMIRKYGTPMDINRFDSIMIDRVRKFGFNSAAAFCPSATKAEIEKNFPYVSDIPVSQWSKRPMKYIPGVRETWDPFDEKNIQNFETNCAQSVTPKADDKLLIGYFLVNEPLYQDIPRVIPTLKKEWACKRRLVQMLEDKYGSVDAFNAAWNMHAQSFADLNDQGLPVATQAAADDMHAYTGLFLDTYFRLVHDTMKKYDPNHMLIGNRLQPGTANNQQLCEISGKYLDVFSLNYYTYGFDSVYLDRLHQWVGDKPMMFTEFYWDSPSDSGLPGGVKDVGSQKDRGLAYRHYVEHAAAIPYVVGVQWFTLVDASVTGQWFSKYHGENPNSGLFSVADRPWKIMIDAMVKTNYRIYDLYLGKTQPFVFDDPRFNQAGKLDQIVIAPKVPQPLTIDGSAGDWPGIPPTQINAKRLVAGNPGDVEATYKLAWDDNNLYVLVEVHDPTPMMNTQTGGNLWQGDGVELFVGREKLDQAGPLLFTDRQILIGAGGNDQYYFVNQPKQPTCHVTVARGSDGYTLEAAIPFSALGITPSNGLAIRFDMAVDDSANGNRRDRQLMWNGIAQNSADRSAWGMVRLTNQ